MRMYFIRFRVSVTNLIMSNFEFLTVAQLEQQIDNNKRKIQHCLLNLKVIKDWIDRVISPYIVSQGYSKILLIIDQATCHKKLTESYDVIEKGIHVLYIPGRMTGFLQPADVGWFATIKKCSQMLNNVDGASPEKTKKRKRTPKKYNNFFIPL